MTGPSPLVTGKEEFVCVCVCVYIYIYIYIYNIYIYISENGATLTILF